MRPAWKQFFRHAILVGVSLAVVGYLLGKAFLLAQQMYGGGAAVEGNERVLWQTPIVMASLGILMSGSIDFVAAMVRKPARVPMSVPPPSNPGI